MGVQNFKFSSARHVSPPEYDYQEEEDEDEDTREIVKDKWLSEDDGNEEEEEEADQDEEDQDEEEEDEEENEEVEEDELDQDGEEEWLPELSAGVKYRGPSKTVDGQVPK